ncbi:MAG: winged helix-turn-helix transcriptional regulator [Erysipelothrix sp.]|nr:winged helix-turn-helix transcriptional regulator [Erysipelothrix sp.]
MIEKTAQLFKMMSEPTRLEILVFLSNEEKSVNEIASSLDIEQSVVSHQLSKLKAARFVKAKRVGRQMFYSLYDDHITALIKQGVEHAQEIN